MRVYQQQLKKLNNIENQQDKEDVIASERKLQPWFRRFCS